MRELRFMLWIAFWVAPVGASIQPMNPAASYLPQPCVSRSIYATGKAYSILNFSGDLMATVKARTSRELAAAYRNLVNSGQCLPNPSSCSLVESSYGFSTLGFVRYFYVLDESNQILAVIAVHKNENPNMRFAELISAGVCARARN